MRELKRELDKDSIKHRSALRVRSQIKSIVEKWGVRK
jgi:hypothetical protein